MSESTVALSVTGKVGTLVKGVVSDPVSAWNKAAGDYDKAASQWASAYVATGQAEEDIRLGRTALAALTVKALDELAPKRKDGSRGKATREDIAKRLGMATDDLNSALPGQWRIAARLYTDLAMDPTAPLTRWLVSTKPAGWGEAADKAKSEADMVEWVAGLTGKAAPSEAKRTALGLPPVAKAIAPATPPATGGESGGESGESGDDTPATGGDDTPTVTPATAPIAGRGPGKGDGIPVDLSGLSAHDFVTVLGQMLAQFGKRLPDMSDDDKAILADMFADASALLAA